MQPKVSAIVPVYNVELYLDKCLNSLVNQTLQDIEILVINDGSPDDSQKIIDDYQKKYPNIVRGYVKKNGGLSDARNFGVEKATGEYLAFIDSDDYVDIDMFEKMYQKAIETDADVVNSPYTDVRGEFVTRKYYGNGMKHFGKSVQESPKILRFANSIACNKIYRRQFWVEHNFKFPVGQWFEDSALIYNIMGSANKVECVNIPFYHYVRSRGDSITNTIDERIFDIFKSVESLINFYKQFFPNAELEEEINYLCLRHTLARAFKFTKIADKELAKRFLNACYDFYDEALPNWKESRFVKGTKKSKLKTKVVRYIRRHRALAELYYINTPEKVWKLLKSIYKTFFAKKKKKPVLDPIKQAKKKEEVKEKKRAAIQKNGMAVMELVQKLLREIGIVCFADFGTMLGLIREGKLLSHDLDVDMGVIIKDKSDMERIKVCLDRFGILLWRQYIFGDNIVEESYRFNGIKIDLNYYQITEKESKTWLFYWDPNKGKEYEYNTRSIVEMTYSPITEFTTINIQGKDICIPANAEQLLVEKYGPTWRTPDKGWIYWESPAATKLPDIGYFITHKHNRVTEVNEEWFNEIKLETFANNRKLQEIQLNAFKAISEICKENNITYYLGESTLRFANIYGKLAPWESNFFILMPKDDYDKFLSVAPNALPEEFMLQHSSLIKNYWSCNMAVRYKDNSEFYETKLKRKGNLNGPAVEILPLCYVPELESFAQKKQRKDLMRYKKWLNYKSGIAKAKTLSTKLTKLKCKFISYESIHNKIEKTYNMFNKDDCKYYVNLASYYKRKKTTNLISDFGEPVYIDFEGTKAPIPANYNEVLEKIYGFKYCKSVSWGARVIKDIYTGTKLPEE